MKQFLYLMVHLISIATLAQDTMFVRSLPLDSAVRNIDSDGEFLYLRFENGFYKWEDNKQRFIENGKFKYSWINFDSSRNIKVINHNDIIKPSVINSAKKLANFIPGIYNYTTTTARVGNLLYICYNGAVIEYKIIPEFTRVHRGNSIRHIYTEPGLRVISTYNGIFIDTLFDQFSKLKIDEKITRYSNGEFVKIDSLYYLCQDNLITYDRNLNELKTVINTEGTPRFRKLLSYNSKVYGLYDNAFGEVNLKTGNRTYLINENLTDFIELNGKLYISSSSSVLYEMNPDETISKYNLKAPINDLFIFDKDLFIGTNSGLFKLKDSSIVEEIPNTEIVQALVYEGRIIFSNNSGLYYLTEGMVSPLIENIEFNKLALHQDQYFLYAGSVNGLYIIKNNQLKDIITNSPSVLKKDNFFIIIISITLLLGIIIPLLIIRKRKQQERDKLFLKRKIIIDKNLVKDVILNNPKILSVGQLAEHLNTSVVQLNRYLKKEKTTGLVQLKSVMNEIAIEMYKNGSSVEEISKRVGYSKRYIKKNFLKG